jgi:hypothetical protein
VKWQIELSPGAKIKRVQVYSYYQSSIEGTPEGVESIVKSHEKDQVSIPMTYIGPWEVNKDSEGGFLPAMKAARQLLGLSSGQERLYHSCYRTVAPIDLGMHLKN